jgi:hypothetical protein
MTTENANPTPTFRTTSPLLVGLRLAALGAVLVALAGGFVAGLGPVSQDASQQLARTPPTCASRPC